MTFFWGLSLARHALGLKLGSFVVLIGSINCPNGTFQLAAVRANEDFEICVFLTQGKTGFFLVLKKNANFKVFVRMNGCELKGAIWAVDRPNEYYKTTKFEPQRMPC